MASLIYTGFLDKLFSAAVDIGEDRFKVMLVTGTYRPNRLSHTTRADVTAEAVGAGYAKGGVMVEVIREPNETAGLFNITLGQAGWHDATLTARGAIYYRASLMAPISDVLVAYIDFGRDITATNGTFDLRPSTMKVGF